MTRVEKCAWAITVGQKWDDTAYYDVAGFALLTAGTCQDWYITKT